MKKMMGIGFGIATALGMSVMVSASTSVVAHADGSVPVSAAPACKLPICDMDKALADFRAMTPHDRFAKTQEIRATYKHETSPEALRNLADFAAKLQALFTELNEADFVIREAGYLHSESMLALAKYMDPDGKALAEIYKEVEGGTRFSILQFWEQRVKAIEDRKQLLEILDFFARAEEISRASGDEDWVPREATYGENAITTKLVQLYPYFEGTYQITTTCEGSFDSAGYTAPCASNLINRLVIMDTLDSGLSVFLSNGDTSTQIYAFSNVVLSSGGTTFEAKGDPNGVSSQLHLVLDKATSQISGWVKNSDALGTLRIIGKLDASPASIFELQTPEEARNLVTGDQLVRSYHGKYGTHSATLTIQSFATDQFGATLAFDEVPNYRMHFQVSRFFPLHDVMVLVGTQPNGTRLKMTLYIKKAGNDIVVTGIGYSGPSGKPTQVELRSN